MKETGYAHWTTPNTSHIATNESGFSALPGGQLYVDGIFKGTTLQGFWWLSTENDLWHSAGWFLYYNNFDTSNEAQYSKDHGLSVRCILDK